jgi:uncharacterized protein
MVKESTIKWINEFVIHHQLCPFAKKVMTHKAYNCVVNESTDAETLLLSLMREFKILEDLDPNITDTAFFIMPNAFSKFKDYLLFVDMATAVLIDLDLDEVFQLATFHPKYQFAGTKVKDAENYTNRSPYPMIHVLREESVSNAVLHYPNIDDIPTNNINKMNELGADYLKKELLKYKSINPSN